MKHIGILGGGNISETHLKAAQEVPGLRVSAVCGPNEKKVANLAKRADAITYSDVGAFLDHSPMDIVAIGSPSGLHAEQGIAAANRGLHVLTEKPIDISTSQAQALIDQCDAADVKLGVFFQDRVTTDFHSLKQRIEAGDLGNLLLATAHVKWFRPSEYYSDSRWRGTWALDGGGALMNQGVHTVDLLLWLMGPVKRVFAKTDTKLHSIEAEDTAVAALEFENGALGTLEATTAAYPGWPRKVFITGSEGTVQIESDAVSSIDLQGVSETAKKKETDDKDSQETSPVVSDVSGHRKILEDFIDAIDQDRSPLCDGREAKRSVALIEAIYQSSRQGCPIDIEG